MGYDKKKFVVVSYNITIWNFISVRHKCKGPRNIEYNMRKFYIEIVH